MPHPFGSRSETELKEIAAQCVAQLEEALDAGLAVVRGGVKASEIAFAENEGFRKYGLGKYVTSEYTRVRGHGIGLFPDQKPQMLEDIHIPVSEGSTVIVHPNTYHPDVGYMVLGDTIVVRADGHESLGALSRDLLPMAQ